MIKVFIKYDIILMINFQNKLIINYFMLYVEIIKFMLVFLKLLITIIIYVIVQIIIII